MESSQPGTVGAELGERGVSAGVDVGAANVCLGHGPGNHTSGCPAAHLSKGQWLTVPGSGADLPESLFLGTRTLSLGS
jgi:hypothetical protein